MNAVVELRPKTAEQLVSEGKLFFISSRLQASSAVRSYGFVVGANVLVLNLFVETGLSCTIDMLEGVTVTTAGTLLNQRNYNRLRPDNSLLTKVYRDTVVTGGVKIIESLSGFGTNSGQASSGTSSETIAYCLKPNTSYLATITPSAATDTFMKAIMYEYEAKDKE